MATSTVNLPANHEVVTTETDTPIAPAAAEGQPGDPVTGAAAGPLPAPAVKLGFFTKLKDWLEVHVKRMPALEVQIASGADYLIPFVDELDDALDPAAALVVNPILDAIKVGLGALAVAITQATTPAGGTNLQLIFTSLENNANTLMTAFKVKDSSLQGRVDDILTLITGEVQAMQNSVTPAA